MRPSAVTESPVWITIQLNLHTPSSRPGITASIKPALGTPTPKTPGGSSPLYPTLNMDEYSVISMPGQNGGQKDGAATNTMTPQSVHALIPHASQLSTALQSNISSLDSLMKAAGQSGNICSATVMVDPSLLLLLPPQLEMPSSN